MTANSFDAHDRLDVGDATYEVFRLDRVAGAGRLPYSLKVLLENLLRNEGGRLVSAEQVSALGGWDPTAETNPEIQFTPARVLMQDFTGVPCVVDLVAMRAAVADLGGDPRKINPLIPAELVIDHSVIADVFGRADAFRRNAEFEFERNQERYQLLRWAQESFDDFLVVPPDTGICHQVNLEYLSRVVFTKDGTAGTMAYPDTLVGTDSHTPMVNGLGVVGWGVGGIEAEAAMLGQPISMLLPQVIGFRLDGELGDAATATDLVLRVTEMLRERGVFSKFVEFYGPGLPSLGLADRATLGNMSPEFGSTCAIFPPDKETLRYLEFTGRGTEVIELVDAYTREQGMFHTPDAEEPTFTDTLELDLGDVTPAIAGPKRPQDRIALSDSKAAFLETLKAFNVHAAGALGTDQPDSGSFPASDPPGNGSGTATGSPTDAPATAVEEERRSDDTVEVTDAEGNTFGLDHGRVVIAAITSCTNTSNPSVMIGAGLLAKKAVERGLDVKPWVKTSLAPGSTVVTDYLEKSGLDEYLNALKFDLVGYGCTTCIGNSGPLSEEISAAVAERDLVVCAVLSGNRNFEGRINQDVKANYLASPPLCVAYALVGRMDFDFESEPLGTDGDDQPVYLRDIWPSAGEISDTVAEAVRADMFEKSYANVFEGDERWKAIKVPEEDRYTWPDSTYVRRPPFFEGMDPEPAASSAPIENARVLAKLGDSITTDHISPAGAIKKSSPAGKWLMEQGIEVRDFNSYGSRRGNHEVMMRGTFANVRLRNELVEREGGWTRSIPDGEEMPIYDAAMRYAADGVPLVILAGKEYGSGSSRDWAAKGTLLLGVRAVIAESFERIHRSNLIGMGVLPLQFPDGENAASLGLTGEEQISIAELDVEEATELEVTVRRDGADDVSFVATVRIDTANERKYFRHGGILHRVLRELR